MLKKVGFSFLVLMLLTAAATATVPGRMTYEGRLTDPSGNPVTTERSFTFSIYAAPTGGSSLWTETPSNITPDSNGVFSAVLGEISADVFSEEARYLEIKVGTDPAMSHRIQLVSSAYAFKAANADSLGGVSAEGYVLKTGGKITGLLTVEGAAHLATATGNVGIGTTETGSYKLYVAGKIKTDDIDETSDQRLKKNIETIDQALKKVEAMRGVYFNWRSDEFKSRNFETDRQVGVIAQEIETILPEVVKTDTDGFKSVEYSRLVGVLIEAIKELKAENISMKSDLDSLKMEMDRTKNNRTGSEK